MSTPPEPKSRNVTRSLMRGYMKSQREAEAAKQQADENLDARVLAANLLTLTVKGSLTVGEAADRLLVTRESLASVVRRLVDSGLINASATDLSDEKTVLSAPSGLAT